MKKQLSNKGLICVTQKDDYVDLKHNIIITNGIYKSYIKPENYIYNNKENIEPRWFKVKNNPFIIDNVNAKLKYKNKEIICISKATDISDRNDKLIFKCLRCGKIITTSLFNAIRDDNSHYGVRCSNCDGTIESIHASVLKQMFLHYYPDTIVEDPSCINDETGYILPTDIVNHRLKIAIEIQSDYHDKPEQQKRDKYKKAYWLKRNYNFYDPDIRDYSVLEICQLFFDIKEIPDFINFEYGNKINIKRIQKYLDDGYKINQIADMENINIHRIYDALQCKKLIYPEGYIKNNDVKVVQLNHDKEYLNTYCSYRQAERLNEMEVGLIASCIYYKSYYSCGYYWIPLELYNSGFIPPTNRLAKYYNPVKQLLDDGTYKYYKNYYEASEDTGLLPNIIRRVASGEKNSWKGFKFKECNV